VPWGKARIASASREYRRKDELKALREWMCAIQVAGEVYMHGIIQFQFI